MQLISAALLMLALHTSSCVAQRNLNWNSFFDNGQVSSSFLANTDNAYAITRFSCADAVFTNFGNVLAGGYVQGSTPVAQAAYGLGLCSYLRPTATGAVSAKASAISTLQAAASQYAPFSAIDHTVAFKQLCITFDLLRPDLDAATVTAFKGLVAKLIPDGLAFLGAVKPKNFIQDNYASSIASMNAICAQTIGDATNVAAAQTKFLSVELSSNQAVANIFDDGTSYDFKGRDAMFYHAVTVSSYCDIARHMPDKYLTPDQWKLIERGIYFVQQFYVVPNVQNQAALVYHREFMTTQYPPDQTTLHGDLYAHLTNQQIMSSLQIHSL